MSGYFEDEDWYADYHEGLCADAKTLTGEDMDDALGEALREAGVEAHAVLRAAVDLMLYCPPRPALDAPAVEREAAMALREAVAALRQVVEGWWIRNRERHDGWRV